jgi:hypothetical protein
MHTEAFWSNFLYFCDGAASRKKCFFIIFFEGVNPNIDVPSPVFRPCDTLIIRIRASYLCFEIITYVCVIREFLKYTYIIRKTNN